MHVVITGATGEIGKCLLPLLIDENNITKITIVARRALDLDHPKLTQLITDFTQLSEAAIGDADCGVCCLGTTMAKAGSKTAFEQVDFDFVVAFAKLVKQSNATQFHVVSASGANKTSFFFYNRVKGAMEEEIRNILFNTACIYRPSLLDSNRTEKRLGEQIAIRVFRVLNPLFIGSLKRFRSIRTSQVALGIFNRIKQPPKGFHIVNSEVI